MKPGSPGGLCLIVGVSFLFTLHASLAEPRLEKALMYVYKDVCSLSQSQYIIWITKTRLVLISSKMCSFIGKLLIKGIMYIHISTDLTGGKPSFSGESLKNAFKKHCSYQSVVFSLLNFLCDDGVSVTGVQGPRSLRSEPTLLVFIKHMFKPNVFIVYDVCVCDSGTKQSADKTAGNE